METKTISLDELKSLLPEKKRRGRPPGAKNKAKEERTNAPSKRRGRPPGSKNKNPGNNVRKIRPNKVDFVPVDISRGAKYFIKKRGSIIGGPYDTWLRAQDAVLDMVTSGAANVTYDIVEGDEG